MPVRRAKTTKSPPVFSHEFVIQNHADIVSCLAMLCIIGLMFQMTSPISSLFVIVHHNITTVDAATSVETTRYTYGLKDLCAIFFYTMICIVLHAVIQEYLIDKINRKLHLSKVKHSKFNESSQLICFYVVALGWACDIFAKGHYFGGGLHTLWDDYPYNKLTFSCKLFYIVQISYWLHWIPEMYFMKLKKEEIPARLQYIVLYVLSLTSLYIFNMTRLGTVLLIFHFFVELLFHLSRTLHFLEWHKITSWGFYLWSIVFLCVRLLSVALSVLTFWYGLEKSSTDTISFTDGNFNIPIFRYNGLFASFVLQAWMLWKFIHFHLKLRREKRGSESSSSGKRGKSKKNKKGSSDGDSGPTENGAVKHRSPKSKKNQ